MQTEGQTAAPKQAEPTVWRQCKGTVVLGLLERPL